MNEQQCLDKMIAPGTPRPHKYRNGVIQVHVTRACDQSCTGCTQGSNLAGKPVMMNPDEFETCCQSLAGYWGVVGVFGGNPCMNPHFVEICQVFQKYFPKEQRGLWSNDLINEENGRMARETFDPAVSNLNVHLNKDSYRRFRVWWPESRPFGLDKDSRHSPPYVAMIDVLRMPCPLCGYHAISGEVAYPAGVINGVQQYTIEKCPECNGTGGVYDEEKAWELISNCDINQHWSAMVCKVPGKGLRAYFCEIAGAQAMLHADDPEWPDTGVPLILGNLFKVDGRFYDSWWEMPMIAFDNQVRWHCHRCGVPLRRRGDMAITGNHEEVSLTHLGIYKPKRSGRSLTVVVPGMPDSGHVKEVTDYMEVRNK
jgi:hypothetical protein